MRLDPDYILSSEPQEQKIQIENALRNVATAVNGSIRAFTPTLYGSTTAGTVTYGVQDGWYCRQGIFIDYFFVVTWTNWVGGVGNLCLNMPTKIFYANNHIFNNAVGTSGLTYKNVGDTYATIRLEPNDGYGYFVSHSNAGAEGIIAVQASGEIRGSIRYMGQTLE